QTAPPPRTSETPVEVRLEPPLPPPPELSEPAPRPEYPPLDAGQTARLQPLPPELLTHTTLPPQPEAPAALKLEILAYNIMQALEGRIASLEDIPLRPILSTQSELKPAFLQALPKTPSMQALPPPQISSTAALAPTPRTPP